ncbi:hypothetical protein ACHAXR_008583 [Thalassiosira sp. AJA248-18]
MKGGKRATPVDSTGQATLKPLDRRDSDPGAHTDDTSNHDEADEIVKAGLGPENAIEVFREGDMPEQSMPDVVANLDVEDSDVGTIDDDDDGVDDPLKSKTGKDGESSETSASGSVTCQAAVHQKFVRSLQCRIKCELSKDFDTSEEAWLMNYLRRNDWVIRSTEAAAIAEKLDLAAALLKPTIVM